MSISATGAPSSAAQTPLQALQAARAQYQRTGIDKDAAAGDPDHDAPPKVNLAKVNPGSTPTSSPATQTSSSAATIANAVASQSTTSAAAASAYSPKVKA
jgi:hypothetical protein